MLSKLGTQSGRTYEPLIFLLIGAVVFFLSCGESRSSDASAASGEGDETARQTSEPADTTVASGGTRTPLPPDLNYEIIGEDAFQDDRRSLDVRLNRKVSEDVLETLAYRLREQTSRSFERTFIVYYLPNMQLDTGGWATSHFDPELDVEILGVSEEATSRVEKIRDQYGQNLIGIWENNQPGSAATFALFKRGNGFGLEQIFPDGSSRTLTVREQPSEIGRRFRDPENTFGEYWLLRQGNLQLHDPKGLVFTARPVSDADS